MGILNVTPDSFSDGGATFTKSAAVARGLRMADSGADLIDIGGESTRPGAAPVPVEEELRRVVPVIERLAKALSIPLSVDTSKARVADEALQAGASIINDVTALQGDQAMATVIARRKASIILMHMRGTPQTMQRHPRYADVAGEVRAFLTQRATHAEGQGIARAKILIDPGLGFGKTVTHNLRLLRELPCFMELGYPVVVGPSRKSFIGRVLNADLTDRLAGTLACVASAWQSGARIVRVHDVKPAIQLIRMLSAIHSASRNLS